MVRRVKKVTGVVRDSRTKRLRGVSVGKSFYSFKSNLTTKGLKGASTIKYKGKTFYKPKR